MSGPEVWDCLGFLVGWAESGGFGSGADSLAYLHCDINVGPYTVNISLHTHFVLKLILFYGLKFVLTYMSF